MPFNKNDPRNTDKGNNTAGRGSAAGDNPDPLENASAIAKKAAAKAEASLWRSEKAAVRREITPSKQGGGKTTYHAGDRTRNTAPRPTAANCQPARGAASTEEDRAAGTAARVAAATAAKSSSAAGRVSKTHAAQPGQAAGNEKLAAARAAREEATEKRSKASQPKSIITNAAKESIQLPEPAGEAQAPAAAAQQADAPAPGSLYSASAPVVFSVAQEPLSYGRIVQASRPEAGPSHMEEPLREEYEAPPPKVPVSEVDIWAVDAVAAEAAAADENDDNRLMGMDGHVGATMAEFTGIGRSRSPGGKTGKKKVQRTFRRARTSFPAYRKGGGNPLVRSVGNILYLLGFYAECKTLMVLRFLRDLGIFIAQVLVWMFGGVFRSIASFLISIGRDFAAPFVRSVNGLKNMRKAMKEARAKGHGSSGAKTAAVGYLANGVKTYNHLVRNLLGLFLPVVALVVLGIVVYATFGISYGLAVKVNGQTIGYVTDRGVVEEAKSILRERLKLSEGQEMADMQITVDLSISRTTEFTPKAQLANGLLSATGAATSGTSLFIDGKLVAATKDGEALREYLDEKLKAAEDLENPDAKVSFVSDVECDPEQEDVFLPDTTKDLKKITDLLESNVSEEKRYSAGAGEVLNDIAHNNDIGVDELVSLNPVLEGKESDYALEGPMDLLVKEAEPYLQVQRTVQVMETEPIPFETEEVETDNFYVGQNFITQIGEEGERNACYKYIYIGDRLVAKNLVTKKTKVTKEPIKQVIECGTKVAESYADNAGSAGAFESKDISITGSGTYIYPLPSALYSSRGGGPGTGHRGRDLNAVTGAPIFAANDGVVVRSEYHYSWGNYVLIQHPDGLLTLYAHCSSLGVNVGQQVGRGDYIAAVGSTGYSTGPHLHLEVWTSNNENSYINPDAVVPCPFA